MAAPTVQAVTEYVELTGTTAAVATVQLVARVEGFLEQIHFSDGARVKQGDLLFTIQQDTYQAQLQQAQSEVGAVKARLEQAQTEFARYSGLFKQKAASAVDVDTWRANLDGAQADLLGAQAKVALAQINLGYTTVTAPFDGRMGRHLIDAGNLVGPGGPAPCWPRSTGSTRSTPISRSTSASCCASAASAARASAPLASRSTRSCSWAWPTRTASRTPASWTSRRSR